MATTNRIGGVLSLLVDGNQFQARGNFEVVPSTVKRDGVAGQDSVHGYTEMPVVPEIKGDISIGNQLSLQDLEGITDSTVQVTLANGVTYVLQQAWVQSAFSIKTQEGRVEVLFQGMSIQELNAAATAI
jgi:hypothetical protein